MLTLWGRRSSSNVQAVMWCLDELNIPSQRIDAGFTYGVTNTDRYLAINPNGTVPTIQDGDYPPLWESGAILRYLAEQYGDDSFWPRDARNRARVDQWAEWSKLNVALKFTAPIFWHVARTPAHKQNPQVIREAVTELESALRIADHQLQTCCFLAGGVFTLADIQFAHVLYRYYDIPIDRAPLEGVANYYAKIAERPAYRRQVAVSYEELRNSF